MWGSGPPSPTPAVHTWSDIATADARSPAATMRVAQGQDLRCNRHLCRGMQLTAMPSSAGVGNVTGTTGWQKHRQCRVPVMPTLAVPTSPGQKPAVATLGSPTETISCADTGEKQDLAVPPSHFIPPTPSRERGAQLRSTPGKANTGRRYSAAPQLPHPAEKLAKAPRCFLSLEMTPCPNEP